MRLSRKTKLSIPRRLLLLTIIPIGGLIAVGGMSFRTLYSEYRSLAEDAQAIAAYQREAADFAAFSDQLAAERTAAVQVFAHRDDPAILAAYRATFAGTDRAVAELYAKLNRLAASPQAALFADKNQSIRSFIDSQLPDARAGTLESKHNSGEVFYIYVKLAYSALGISEASRATVRTPEGYNLFDAIFAMQKAQIQETIATILAVQGLQSGGLPREELSILRRQFFVSAENEYYMLKFQPELRGYFKATTRKTDDDASFYLYLQDISGTQLERLPFPEFKPKSKTLAELVAAHFAAYDDVYRYSFAFAERTLTTAAQQRRRHAFIVGGGLIAVIVFSLGVNLAITRSTRRSLAHVANNIDQASADVKSASSQLAASGNRIADNATHYASAIEEISARLGEVSTVAETNKGHAAKATATTEGARDSVGAGLGTIHQLDAAMNSARTSGQKINQVIARINDLSFQTNLLALNAAVEAARAGEAGAGFAVVADEVRRLAARCAEAARETAELIGESARDTATAIAMSDDLATRFKNVSCTIHEVNEIVSLMNSNFVQQASSIGEINRSVSDQRAIAQSLVATAEETAQTALSMDNQVDSLEQSLARMDSLLGQARAQNHAPSEEQFTEQAEPLLAAAPLPTASSSTSLRRPVIPARAQGTSSNSAEWKELSRRRAIV